MYPIIWIKLFYVLMVVTNFWFFVSGQSMFRYVVLSMVNGTLAIEIDESVYKSCVVIYIVYNFLFL